MGLRKDYDVMYDTKESIGSKIGRKEKDTQGLTRDDTINRFCDIYDATVV